MRNFYSKDSETVNKGCEIFAKEIYVPIKKKKR